jgi:[ribosomal protein S5]-alanine N-acetyltransferase
LDDESTIVWAICHNEAGHVGNITLQDISHINRTAEFAIILGDRNHWGKGLGQLAGRQLLEHGFTKLNIARIYCGTAASNEGMKKLAISLGMTEEGVRRRHLFLDGCHVDMVEYGILKSEFTVA